MCVGKGMWPCCKRTTGGHRFYLHSVSLEVSNITSWAIHMLPCALLCKLSYFFLTLLLYACFLTDILTHPAKTPSTGTKYSSEGREIRDVLSSAQGHQQLYVSLLSLGSGQEERLAMETHQGKQD